MEKVLASGDGVVVVNFEIWRKDKDLLAKLMSWQTKLRRLPKRTNMLI